MLNLLLKLNDLDITTFIISEDDDGKTSAKFLANTHSLKKPTLIQIDKNENMSNTTQSY